jgi:hypothetical protein
MLSLRFCLPSLILGCFFLGAGSLTWADDAPPFGVCLLAKNSLAGWDYGITKPHGWEVVDGQLRGARDATPLVSGFTFGDFELRFTWSVADDKGIWKIAFPHVPHGQGIALSLSPQLLPSGDKSRREHEAVVHREGEKLSLLIDGVHIAERALPPEARVGLGLALGGSAGMIRDLRVAEPAGELLFNEQDLTGWWTPGNLASWEVVDTTLVCVNKNGNYLRTEKEYGNFTLSLDYRITKGGNSGVGIRTPRDGWPSGDGMELQIEDEPPGKPITRSSTMGIYGNLEPLLRADRSEEWNHAVIKADGYMISAWMNGVLVQQANTRRLPELKHRHLKGWIGFQDHGTRTEFRNVRILEAPEGTGLDIWNEPRPMDASELVVNRLMNPERLTHDRLQSRIVLRKLETSKQEVMEFAGPAAIVGMQFSRPDIHTAWYFDDETAARIECKAGALADKTPHLAPDRSPLVTYVPYRKMLRIVLESSKAADVRFDEVRFAGDTPIESYSGPQTSTARGLLPAISYRYQQHGFGTVREHDPLPRVASGKKTIDPGSTLPLVSLEAAGVVQWLKLDAPQKAMESDDLWLEVTVDGETSPAISAPARYFFPGLSDGKNYQNFVVLKRNGYVNRLAMPYGAGLLIAVTNRGQKPIKDVAATLSFEPAASDNKEEIAGHPRLRGIFQQGGASDFVSLTSGGRLIGTVSTSAPVIESLTIDDNGPITGWSSASGNSFFGLTNSDGDERHALSGRYRGLVWRYFLAAPIDFQKSLMLKSSDSGKEGSRLALYYAKK